MKNFPRELNHDSGPLLLDDTRLLLVFQAPLEREAVAALLARFDLSLEMEDPETGVPGELVNHTARHYWVNARRTISQQLFEAVEKAAGAIGIEVAAPVYRLLSETGRRALLTPLPNVIVVRLREGQEETDALALLNGWADPMLREVEGKSRYLNGRRYFVITNPGEINAYQLKQRIEQEPGVVTQILYETMPLIRPTAATPNDPLFTQQWDMVRIDADAGWDISTGVASVVVCVLDEGCDLNHPDLHLTNNGVNLSDVTNVLLDGRPTGNHGTACAGIVAATFNNAAGLAGVAGSAGIVPAAFSTWSDVEVAIGINWCVGRAQIISMSFGWNAWSHAVIDPAILNAFNNNLVMCVATHNHNGAITYPATNPLVMAVGASDQIDNRKSPSSPDGEGWGSNFGAAISVVAPGVQIPTTDRQGAAGYNPTPGTGGDYALLFNGTSSATPHVAGLAALIRSLYPALSNVEVRRLIERTAERVGVVPYADVAGHPNGTWNQEMGYGRINVFRALDAADVFIRDDSSDDGTEPFTGGNFWDYSDIVVRPVDDGIFVPGNLSLSRQVERGQANYVYIRVVNNGPRTARNVTVKASIIPAVATMFVYPQDWTLNDPNHVPLTPITASFAAIAPGSANSVIAKFGLSSTEVDKLYGWETGSGWHPCMLAQVFADNDYAFDSAPLTANPARLNNLAQRNLSLIDAVAGASMAFPFITGSRFSADRSMALVIDRSRLPHDMPLLLSIDDDGSAFPLFDFAPPVPTDNTADNACGDSAVVFLDRARIRTRLGCCVGEMTLEKGSRFDCLPVNKPGRVTVVGGDVILRGDRRFVDIRSPQVTVHVEKVPNAIHPMSLHTTIPRGAAQGQQFTIGVAQLDGRGATVGGATMVYRVK